MYLLVYPDNAEVFATERISFHCHFLYSVAAVRNYFISLSIDYLIFGIFGMIDLNDTNVMRANKVVLWKRDCILLK